MNKDLSTEMFHYGAIGNCRTAALVSDKGSIDWLCLPDFDSASVFASILDKEKGGHFSINTNGYNINQRYIAHTNILCIIFRQKFTDISRFAKVVRVFVLNFSRQ